MPLFDKKTISFFLMKAFQSTQLYFLEMYRLQEQLLDFLNNETYENADLELLIKNISNVQKDHISFKSFLRLFCQISNQAHRNSFFNTKINDILQVLAEDIKLNISNFEIFTIFENNKLILPYLFDQKIITPNLSIFHRICRKNYKYFLFKEFPDFLSKRFVDSIKKLLNKEGPNSFEQKRKIGENDNFICKLIRDDSIDEFIQYINMNKIDSLSEIPSSIYETNPLLLKNSVTLIEYAAFFGSNKIFKYLLENNRDKKSSIWIYAIHGQNAQIIDLLEKNKIDPPNNSYIKCIKELIKCHNNQMFSYLYHKLTNIDDNLKSYFFSKSLKYYNFNILMNKTEGFNDIVAFLNSDLNEINNKEIDILINLCKFDYIYAVNLLLQNKNIIDNINTTYILLLLLFNRIKN